MPSCSSAATICWRRGCIPAGGRCGRGWPRISSIRSAVLRRPWGWRWRRRFWPGRPRLTPIDLWALLRGADGALSAFAGARRLRRRHWPGIAATFYFRIPSGYGWSSCWSTRWWCSWLSTACACRGRAAVSAGRGASIHEIAASRSDQERASNAPAPLVARLRQTRVIMIGAVVLTIFLYLHQLILLLFVLAAIIAYIFDAGLGLAAKRSGWPRSPLAVALFALLFGTTCRACARRQRLLAEAGGSPATSGNRRELHPPGIG